MREFKIRAFKTKNCPEMFNDVASIDWNNNEIKLNYKLGNFERLDTDKLDIFKLMQYTGLKDSNGVEIYEGDILKRVVAIELYGSDTQTEYVEDYLLVKYREEYGGFFIEGRHIYEYVDRNIDVWTGCRCTKPVVVGNIFENPELLEEE